MGGRVQEAGAPGGHRRGKPGRLDRRRSTAGATRCAALAVAAFLLPLAAGCADDGDDLTAEACRERALGTMAISIDRPSPDRDPMAENVRSAVERQYVVATWEKVLDHDLLTWEGRDQDGTLLVVADVVRVEDGWGPGGVWDCSTIDRS